MVERKNRFVQDNARTMLLAADLHPKFWREEVGAVVYYINRAKLRINSDKTPYEWWKGRLVSVKYFRIFGSKCFMKINEDSPGKFYSWVDEGIFIRYSTRRKAYKCYNNRLWKLVESIDVNINESLPKKEVEISEEDLVLE